MHKDIRKILTKYNPTQLSVPDNYKKAAVLIPLLQKDDKWHILFTKRTEHLTHHKGQISFPGGGMETQDNNLCVTALRETEEEIGISEDYIEILGAIDDYDSVVSRFIVRPFVGKIKNGFTITINRDEIDNIFCAPLEELLDPSIHYQKWRNFDNRNYLINYYQWNDRLIWGVTGNILTNFFNILRDVLAMRYFFPS